MREETIVHPFAPIIDNDCRILILGSLPSVKSREVSFYYGHPRNRFWKVMSAVLNEEIPLTNDEKKKMLLKHHIALWDTIKKCVIQGSSDASIHDVVTNDINDLIQGTKITKIYCNGKTSEKYYKKYIASTTGIRAIVLPSTSPANARMSLDDLISHWHELIKN